MKNTIILILISSLLATSLFVFPQKAKADYAPSFGGYIGGMIPCTCAAGSYSLYIIIKGYYKPLPDPLTPVVPTPALFLTAFTTMPTVYSTYSPLTPGRFILGHYYPVPVPCLVGIPPVCVPIPALGMIGPDTGTSLPTSPVGP